MKFWTILIVVLFSSHFGGINAEEDENVVDFTGSPESEFILEERPTTKTITTTTHAPEQDDLDNISIQDLLLSEVDANEKIHKKIINQMKDFPANYRNNRRPIRLSTNGYVFPKTFIKYDLDKGQVTFWNVSVSSWNDYTSDSEFDYSLTCYSSTTAKLRVGLPSNVQISANFSITHPLIKSENEGGITIVIRNGTISKQNHNTVSNDEFSKISYTNSEIDINFDAGPPSLIYNKLETFFDEVESSLRQFFAQQLDSQMEESGSSLTVACWRFDHAEPFARKIPSRFLNSYLNNLYVIPIAKIETWKGITISAGPIVIGGFSFNSTEFSVSKKYEPNYGFKKRLISQVKTGSLKGKFEWRCNLCDNNGNDSSLVFKFTLGNILFEETFIRRDSYGGWDRTMDVYLGKMKIKPSVANSNIHEVKFAEFVLSEYLKSAIAETFKKSLSEIADDSWRSYIDYYFNS